MRAIEAGLQFLVKCGIRNVFGIPAGSINALYDAMMDIPELKSIIAKHETSAGYMATAYTRITGIPSLCVGSSGPGATNLVTAAANAWKEKLPVIFITGSVPSTKIGKGAGQELDAVPIFASVTKLSKIVMNANQLPTMLEEAYRVAVSGIPGPVHLALPINIQMTDIGNPPLPSVPRPQLYAIDELSIKQVSELAAAKRRKGALLLGHGAKTARSAIIRFAELTGWMVATTPRGKGAFPEDHPLSLGVYGLSGNKRAIDYLNGSDHDVLMVVGSSLGEAATCNWEPRLVQGKTLVHVDIDSLEFGKNYIPDLTVCGYAEIVMERIISRLGQLNTAEWNSGKSIQQIMTELIDPWIAQQHNTLPMDAKCPDWNTLAAIRQISACAPDNARFCIDIGEFMTYSIQNLHMNNERDFDLDISLGAMGSGVGAAIGAKLAEPNRPVICITGDGCFFMHGLEVLTAKEYDIPLVFIVINNARLGMVYHGHMMQYKRCLEDFSQARTDIAGMVQALGIRSYQVHSLADLQPNHFQEWFTSQGPVVIEVVVDGNEIPPIGERVKFLQGAAN